MNRQLRWRQVVFGRDRNRSVRWLNIAAVLVVVAGITFAISGINFLILPDSPRGLFETILSYALLGIFAVSIATVLTGIVAAAVHGYLNDGLLVSIALAAAPVVGLAVGYIVSDQIIYAVDPKTWAGLEGGLYVFIVGGSIVLAVGILGTVLGATVRRLVDDIRSQKVA